MKMKKILAITALLLSSVSSAHAVNPSCAESLGNVFTPAQKTVLCKVMGSAVPQSMLPSIDNTYDLGSASKQWKTIYAGTSIINAGQTTTNGLITATTAEEAVAGAGTTVADAAALSATKHLHQITGANGTLGWKFTTGMAVGTVDILLNTTAGVAKIYGESGSTCNGGAADAACTLLSGIAPHICWKSAALTYICS